MSLSVSQGEVVRKTQCVFLHLDKLLCSHPPCVTQQRDVLRMEAITRGLAVCVDAIRKRRLFLNFSYVCPERVLVK